MSSYSVLVYSVRNLGDMIQTAALSRLLPPCAGVFRHRLHAASEGQTLVVNGVLHRDRPPRRGPTCLFAGVSGPYGRQMHYLDWMRRSPYPIGARDPFAFDALVSAGLDAVMLGCATLTLARYEGARSGIYSVDYPGPGVSLTHRISRRDSVPWQWARAMEYLALYRTAEAVYTSRLHVALPCLAFGTPLWIANPRGEWKPERFSLLEEIGVSYETLATRDVSAWARRYIAFLQEHLGIPIVPADATLPDVTDRPGPMSRFRW
jgi:hypothetical protein